jgi:hypothetical protein
LQGKPELQAPDASQLTKEQRELLEREIEARRYELDDHEVDVAAGIAACLTALDQAERERDEARSLAVRMTAEVVGRTADLAAARAEVERLTAFEARVAEMSRRIDELTSWHDDEKAWRVGAEQERDDAVQRVRALEDDCETAGAALGAVCLLATVAVGEKYAGPTDHAAVAAVVEILGQRDAVAVAAREYLMRSVPDPNVGVDAEDTLRCILDDLGAKERDDALAAVREDKVERLSAQADDVLAELDLLDAEFVEFANGSHGHLRVKRALAALRGKDGG